MSDYFNKGPVKDDEHRRYVKSLPCCVPGCRRGPVDPHHVGPRGMSQKSSDRETVPACRFHHDQYHNKGRAWFEQHHLMGTSILELAQRLYADRKVGAVA